MTYEIVPTNINEAWQLAEIISKTDFAGIYKNKPSDILVAMQYGAEIGLKPLQAIQNVAVINGKPSIYGDAALAIVMSQANFEDIHEYIEESEKNITAVCIVKMKGREPVVSKFSLDDANKAGLISKNGPWKTYPKRMLQMRARGFALRDAAPNALKGLITREEAEDYPEQKIKDITPAEKKPTTKEVENIPCEAEIITPKKQTQEKIESEKKERNEEASQDISSKEPIRISEIKSLLREMYKQKEISDSDDKIIIEFSKEVNEKYPEYKEEFEAIMNSFDKKFGELEQDISM